MTDPCPFCEGTGFLPVPNDPESRAKCKCTLERLYRAKLGQEIFEAKNLKEKTEYTDLMDNNLFVVSTRRDFMPHLRYALIDKGLNYFARVTNDSQMLDAWLSKEKSRSRDGGTTEVDYFTSLRDLTQDPQLLIIFLCVVSYPNRALPGVLLEALRIRDFEGKPTWVINPHAHPFTEGHLCWSTEVEGYISENFKTRKIAPSIKTKSLYEGVVRRKTEVLDPKTGEKKKSEKMDISLGDF